MIKILFLISFLIPSSIQFGVNELISTSMKAVLNSFPIFHSFRKNDINDIVSLTKNIFGNDCFGTCYPKLGCIPSAKKCFPAAYGICSNPENLDILDIKTNVYNENTNLSKTLSVSSEHNEIINLPFNSSAYTVVIVASSNGYQDWIQKIRNLYARRLSDVNIISIIWNPGINQDEFLNGQLSTISTNWQQVKANTMVVAEYLTLFMRNLVNYYSANLTNSIFIGSNIGSHVIGFAARRIKESLLVKIPRIIALDPTGPCFDSRFGNKIQDGLSSNDARIVMIFHTNSWNMGLGYLGLIGHYDFFVNNGIQQSSCSQMNMDAILCSHQFANKIITADYYRDAGDCQPVAYKCTNYEDFLEGLCTCDITGCAFAAIPIQLFGEEKWPIDYKTTKGKKSYYIKTSEEYPFCSYHYQVAAKIKAKSPAYISFYIEGKAKKLIRLKRTKKHYYMGIVTIPASEVKGENPGPFGKAMLMAVNSGYEFEFIRINYMSNMDPKIRKKYSTMLCPTVVSDLLYPC